MKILFIVPYPLKESPSQRFRFEQYLKALSERKHKIVVKSFLGHQGWRIMFLKGHPVRKMGVLFLGWIKRGLMLFMVPSFDSVFIHREAAPFGPPVVEWIIAKVFRKKIIYDFDDAIWLTDRLDEPVLLKWIKWRKKVMAICRWSHKISCGNHYLCDFARNYNSNVVYNPTTIDTENLHTIRTTPKPGNELVIGWTGSHSTLRYLTPLKSVLEKICEKYSQIKILIISNEPPPLALKSLTFLPWNKKTEIQDLLQMDIGIMPLPDEEWSKGKCGFKALQYLSVGIPALVSPVGVNTSIVDDGMSGFYCATEDAWMRHLEYLIHHAEVRNQMGDHGRQKVINNYSVLSNSSNFFSLFE